MLHHTSPASGSSALYRGLILRCSLGTGSTDLIHTNAAIQPSTSLDCRNLDMTPDGQHIVFVASTNGTSGATICILLWDAATGAATLVSGDLSNQVVTNATCDWPAFDSTGQFVLFNSSAANLTTNTLLGSYHLYLRDTQAGTTTLLDADTNGVGSFIGPLTVPCLSANARFVVFECDDGNLVPNDRNRDSDVVVRDLQTGVTTLVSFNKSGVGPGNAASYSPVIGSGGRYVMFRSNASNLAGGSFSGTENLFLRDLQVGTNYVLTSAGLCCAAMTPDGRFVAFVDLVGSSSDKLYVWASGSAAKVYTNTTSSIATVATSPDGNRVVYGLSSNPRNLLAVDRAAGTSRTISTNRPTYRAGLRFSADNRFLAYTGVLNKTNQVYLYDFQTGTNLLVSQAYNSTTRAMTHPTPRTSVPMAAS